MAVHSVQGNFLLGSVLMYAICVEKTFILLTLSLPIPLRLYTFPYWSNPPVLIFDILALSPECQSARMSTIKTGGLDQYGAECFKQ